MSDLIVLNRSRDFKLDEKFDPSKSEGRQRFSSCLKCPHLWKPPTTQFTREEKAQNIFPEHTRKQICLTYRMQAVAMSFLDQWSSVRPGLHGSVLVGFRPGLVHSVQSSE